ncbi:MAG: TetR/AcrR family transcriptional regulator [Bacteroidota bacterium]
MPRPKTFDETVVLEKAMELFWQQGYHATGYNDLVKHLGISRASLYDTYGPKHELFEKAFKLYTSQNNLKTKAFLAQQESVLQGLKKLLINSMQEDLTEAGPKGCLVVNTATELLADDPHTAAYLLAHKEETERLFAEFLERGQRQGEITTEQSALQLAEYFFAFYGGLKVMVKIRPEYAYLASMIETGLKALASPNA